MNAIPLKQPLSLAETCDRKGCSDSATHWVYGIFSKRRYCFNHSVEAHDEGCLICWIPSDYRRAHPLSSQLQRISLPLP